MQHAVPSFIPPTVATSAAAPGARRGMSAGTLAFGAAIVIAATGLGFAGGRLTAPTATAARGNFNGNFAGGNVPGGSFNPNAGGGRGGFGFGGSFSVAGQVTAVSGSSVTIQTAGGQTVTLTVPSTVAYHTQAPGSASDVAVGANVQITATRPNVRPDASGAPAAGGQTGGSGPGGFSLNVTDITVLSK
jgi:hypothetical protein